MLHEEADGMPFTISTLDPNVRQTKLSAASFLRNSPTGPYTSLIVQQNSNLLHWKDHSQRLYSGFFLRKVSEEKEAARKEAIYNETLSLLSFLSPRSRDGLSRNHVTHACGCDLVVAVILPCRDAIMVRVL